MAKRRRVDEHENGHNPAERIGFDNIFHGLPKDIIYCIYEHRAISRLCTLVTKDVTVLWAYPQAPPVILDYDRYWEHSSEGWYNIQKDVTLGFWEGLCKWLRCNKAVIAGSSSVHSLVGGDGAWIPNDVDIFIHESNMNEETVSSLANLLRSVIPGTQRNKLKINSFDIPTNGNLLQNDQLPPKTMYRMPMGRAVHTLTYRSLRAFHLIVVGDNSCGTPFYKSSELTKRPLRWILHETFDIKICASCFDGEQFHIVDFPLTIRNISRVVPRRWCKRSDTTQQAKSHIVIVSKGNSPKTGKAFKAETYIPTKDGDGLLHGKLGIGLGLAFETTDTTIKWIKANGLYDWDTQHHFFHRMFKYLQRGLFLALGMQFANKEDAIMTVIHERGVCHSFPKLASLLQRVHHRISHFTSDPPPPKVEAVAAVAGMEEPPEKCVDCDAENERVLLEMVEPPEKPVATKKTDPPGLLEECDSEMEECSQPTLENNIISLESGRVYLIDNDDESVE